MIRFIRINISFWLDHIYFFIYNAIQESCIDIHLIDVHIMFNCNSQYCSNVNKSRASFFFFLNLELMPPRDPTMLVSTVMSMWMLHSMKPLCSGSRENTFAPFFLFFFLP